MPWPPGACAAAFLPVSTVFCPTSAYWCWCYLTCTVGAGHCLDWWSVPVLLSAEVLATSQKRQEYCALTEELVPVGVGGFWSCIIVCIICIICLTLNNKYKYRNTVVGRLCFTNRKWNYHVLNINFLCDWQWNMTVEIWLQTCPQLKVRIFDTFL